MKLATHLTYSHASLWGCTFKEAVVTLVTLQVINIVINIVAKIIVGTTVYTLIPGFILALIMTGSVLRIIGSIKKGKQEGYLALKTRMFLNRYLNKSIPYITRTGSWSTRRTKRS